MNPNEYNKVIPALDRYMLAKLKYQQVISQTGKAPLELANEVSNAQDCLTEEWAAIHQDFLKTINHKQAKP